VPRGQQGRRGEWDVSRLARVLKCQWKWKGVNRVHEWVGALLYGRLVARPSAGQPRFDGLLTRAQHAQLGCAHEWNAPPFPARTSAALASSEPVRATRSPLQRMWWSDDASGHVPRRLGSHPKDDGVPIRAGRAFTASAESVVVIGDGTRLNTDHAERLMVSGESA